MGKLRLLTVAELSWRNGHEYALEAAAILRRRGVELEYRLVGQGDFLEAVAFARHQLGQHDSVRLIERASPAELERHFAWADLFLLAAVASGAGSELLQAVRLGLPFICTDVPGLLPEGRGSAEVRVVPRRSARALADALLDLVPLAE